MDSVAIVLDPLEEEFQTLIRVTLDNQARLDDSDSAWWALSKLGALSYGVPRAAGGLDLGVGVVCLVCEELGRRVLSVPYIDCMTTACCIAELDDSRCHWSKLATLMEGRIRVATLGVFTTKVGSWGMSRDGDTRRVSGVGTFVADPPFDAFVVRVPEGESGSSLYWIPGDREAVRVVAQGDVAGKAVHELRLEGTLLRSEDIVGRPGVADAIFEQISARARLCQAALLIGMCRGSYEETRRYTMSRRQFGSRLADFQSIRFKLSAHLARLLALQLKLRWVARLVDASVDARLESTETLALVGELALEITRDAMHFHGAHGMTAEAGVQRFYRRAAAEVSRMGTIPELWREAWMIRGQRSD